MANTNGPTRERIRQESYALLCSRGLKGLSMRALADRLGIKAASLYKHVEGKDEVIADLQARGLVEITACLDSAGDSLADVAVAYRDWALSNPHLYEVTVRAPLLRERLPAGLEERAVATVTSATGSSHERARALWGLVHGLVDLELAGRFPDDADLEGTWREALAMIAR